MEPSNLHNVKLDLSYFFFSVFEGELSDQIPVFHASIAGIAIVGRLSVGKSFCLLLCPNILIYN